MIELWLSDEAWHARPVNTPQPVADQIDFPAEKPVGDVLRDLRARFLAHMVAVVAHPPSLEWQQDTTKAS